MFSWNGIQPPGGLLAWRRLGVKGLSAPGAPALSLLAELLIQETQEEEVPTFEPPRRAWDH